MSAKVKLEVIEGLMRGKKFIFDEYDTFLFGRIPDCHAYLPDDPLVSRHHFIVEANPPDACIRDLGSLNGTYVNGIKYGSRKEDETPEQGAVRIHPEVSLKDGDRIKVGDTVIMVQIEGPAICCRCNCDIPKQNLNECVWIGGKFICPPCKSKQISLNKPDKPPKPKPVLCQMCGKDVSSEVNQIRKGDYVCSSCRKKTKDDPAVLIQIMKKMGLGDSDRQTPEIAGYKISRQLGAGGNGTVYLAWDRIRRQNVAIKVMLAQVAVDERSRRRFQREIDIMKKLQHKQIVSLLDHGSAGGVFYFIMDYCKGGSLEDLMSQRGGKLSLSEAGPIMLDALGGLAYAHQQNFVHRDLKPGNILLAGSEGKWPAKVADFGLATDFRKAGFSGFQLTRPGSVAGTLGFMPREQVRDMIHVTPPQRYLVHWCYLLLHINGSATTE
ncbi:protein kinase [Planctomycetota bacterium]